MTSKNLKRIITYLVTIILLVLSPILILVGLIYTYPDYHAYAYSRAIQVQYNYLKETQGEERIIFVGTSSLTYGIDAQTVQDALGKTIVTFGNYGAMGNVAMLDWCEDLIQEGDIVIYMYDIYDAAMRVYFSADITLEGIYRNVEMFNKLSLENKTKVLSVLPQYLYNNISSYREKQTIPKYADINAPAFTLLNFNEKGWYSYYRSGNIMALGYEPDSVTWISPLLVKEEFTSEVNEWASSLKKKGAQVYFSYGPVNDLSRHKLSTDTLIDKFMEEWEKQIGITSINDMKDCYLPSSYFYDGNFHLNSEGAKYFTSYMIRNIETQLYGYTTYELYTPELD